MYKPNYDHFIKSHNIQFTGLHMLIDMSGLTCSNDILVKTLDDCLSYINATVLHKNIHNFDENNGISGCYTLAESHLSFHSWWEAGGVLILDFFTCGETNPLNALDILKTLNPTKTNIRVIPRGPLYLNKNKGIYNVYALYDPRSGLPFYVGKGTKSRLSATLRPKKETPKDNYLREMQQANIKPILHIITNDTCEELALLIETYIINFYGKQIDGGILTNVLSLDKPASSEKIADSLKIYFQYLTDEKKEKRAKAISFGLKNEDIEKKELDTKKIRESRLS